MLLADVFVAEVEELKNHYDVRAEYSRQMASALANKVDKHLLSLAILASRVTTANVTGGNVGSEITDADCHTNATSLIDSVFEAIQKSERPHLLGYVRGKENEGPHLLGFVRVKEVL